MGGRGPPRSPRSRPPGGRRAPRRARRRPRSVPPSARPGRRPSRARCRTACRRWPRPRPTRPRGRSSTLGELGRHAVGAQRDAARDRLAHHEHVGLAGPRGAVRPPGPATSVWVSSRTSSVPASRVEPPQPAWKPSSGMDHAAVGDGRLGEHAGHVPARELALDRLEVVVRHDPHVPGGVGRRGRGPRARHRRPSSSPSSSSACPWYLPSNIRTALRPVAAGQGGAPRCWPAWPRG